MKNKNMQWQIHNLLLVILLLSTVSCNTTDKKNRIAWTKCNTKLTYAESKYNALWKKQLELEQEIKSNEFNNRKYQGKIQNLEARIKQMEVSNGHNIPESTSFDSLKSVFGLKSFKSNKDIFRFIFNNYVVSDYKILYGVSSYNYDDSPPSFKEYNTLMEKIDRSASNIEHLYTENDKQFVYYLFLHNNYYKTSGMQCIVEGLLSAYEEVGDNDTLLEEMYTVNTGDDNWDERREKVASITTENMKTILSDENYDNEYSTIDNRIFYVYTFWARRHHEGNSDIVYKILSDFHKKVKK